MTGEKVLEARHISVSAGRQTILSDCSLEVGKGEFIGIIGPNGAGKSTLLKLVSGVMKPTEGTIEIGGNICPMIELGAGFDMDLTGCPLYTSPSPREPTKAPLPPFFFKKKKKQQKKKKNIR